MRAGRRQSVTEAVEQLLVRLPSIRVDPQDQSDPARGGCERDADERVSLLGHDGNHVVAGEEA